MFLARLWVGDARVKRYGGTFRANHAVPRAPNCYNENYLSLASSCENPFSFSKRVIGHLSAVGGSARATGPAASGRSPGRRARLQTAPRDRKSHQLLQLNLVGTRSRARWVPLLSLVPVRFGIGFGMRVWVVSPRRGGNSPCVPKAVVRRCRPLDFVDGLWLMVSRNCKNYDPKSHHLAP